MRIPSKPEAEAQYQRLASIWNIDRHYWWPLTGTRPLNAEAFQDWYVEHELGHETLRRILTEHGVIRILEFREDGETCELPTSSIDPSYSGLESFWTSDQFDWIIYASHESSVTIGGQWLLPAVKSAWPNWQNRIWTTPFFEKPESK